MSNLNSMTLNCKVYIENLNPSTSQQNLETFFGRFGSMKNVWMGNSGFALIEYRSPRDAQNVVKYQNGKMLDGSRLKVRMASVEDAHESPEPGDNRDDRLKENVNLRMPRHHSFDPRCKVYVGKLRGNTDYGDLKSRFSEYGSVKDVWLSTNPSGFGFIEYVNARDAEYAVQAMNAKKQWIRGEKVVVSMASDIPSHENSAPGGSRAGGRGDERPRSNLLKDANGTNEREPTHRDMNLECKVYVSNLGMGTSIRDLEYFGCCGDVKKTWVSNALGYGFVEFKNSKDAELAAKIWNGDTIRGSMIRVTMASSHSGESPKPAGRHGGRGKFELRPTHSEGVDPRESEIDHRFMNRKCKVYIDNLTNDTTREDVESKFRSWGEIKSVWISNPPAYGYLEFKNLEDAEVAVSIMDGDTISGAEIRVTMASSWSGESPNRGGQVGGRRDDKSGPSLREGDTDSSSRSYRERTRSRSRSPSRRSRSRSPLSRSSPSWIADHRRMAFNRKVFVGNLSIGTTREDLESCFSQFGNLKRNGETKVWISIQPFGHGFVEFMEREDAEKAVQHMQLKGLSICDAKVLVEHYDVGQSSDAGQSSSRPNPRAAGAAYFGTRPCNPPQMSVPPPPRKIRPFNYRVLDSIYISPNIMTGLLNQFLMDNPEVQNSWETIFEQIKEALDEYGKTFFEAEKTRLEDPDLKLPNLIQFAAMVFRAWPFLKEEMDMFHLHFAAFEKYQESIPTYGAIMLNADMSKVVLVGSRRRIWGFPKGKINLKEGEEPVACAIREVHEETGFNISAIINAERFLEAPITGRLTRLYVVPGVSEKTIFKRKPSEITALEWVPVRNLESYSSFLTIPFIGLIREWIDEARKSVLIA